MNPAVYDAIDKGYELGLDLSMGTNGTILKHNKLKNMLKKLVYLRFNISAATPESYKFIHQTSDQMFFKTIENIKKCVEIKKKNNFDVTIGLQMVLIPECLDQVIPLSKLGAELGVDYFVIKHCSDSETGELNIPLEKYPEYEPILKEAETYSNDNYQVIVKWKKIMGKGIKQYDHCLGIPFLLQISGNGDVKPCGFLFPKKGYLMGNIIKQSFKDIFWSENYWNIIKHLATEFDVHTQCGTACRQDYINKFLWDLKYNKPDHINFI
jgi:MoaA/NifB/PqqE/SkfB family radical SAM enzyme